MLRGQGQSHRTLATAVEVAVSAGHLPELARGYGKTDLLEALSEAMGLARNALKNLYYRDEPRLEIVLQAYITKFSDELSQALKDLRFRQFQPIVWKRAPRDLRESRRSLPKTVAMLIEAEKRVRETAEANDDLRRQVGTVAAEVMACALTFYNGSARGELLTRAEGIFKGVMGPLNFEMDIPAEDAALFAKFWENRATDAGLKWSVVWDEPSRLPDVSMATVELALHELDKAAHWAEQHPLVGPNGTERQRQLRADKAKWLVKVGRFGEAWNLLDSLGDDHSHSAQHDALLVRTFEHIAHGRMVDASSSASELAALAAAAADEDSLAPVTSAILVHNIELLRGRRPPLTSEIETFLGQSPIAASEMVDLVKYRDRLSALGYAIPGPAFS